MMRAMASTNSSARYRLHKRLSFLTVEAFPKTAYLVKTGFILVWVQAMERCDADRVNPYS